MDVVGQAEVVADLLDDLGDGGVVGVADFGEEVVFDLVVETAEEPGEDFAALGEVDGGLDLMNGPGMLHSIGFTKGQRELGLLITVG